MLTVTGNNDIRNSNYKSSDTSNKLNITRTFGNTFVAQHNVAMLVRFEPSGITREQNQCLYCIFYYYLKLLIFVLNLKDFQEFKVVIII